MTISLSGYSVLLLVKAFNAIVHLNFEKHRRNSFMGSFVTAEMAGFNVFGIYSALSLIKIT